ncbi:MAG: hypothetical protein KDI71_24065 [Xanthomonadales bacterium]|nr:hypothetical protein [Xanthomonadales bacterium]
MRDDLPLEAAWREHARRHGLREVKLGQHATALRAALEVEVELFGGAAYRERLRLTQLTSAAVSALLCDHQPYLLGLPAVGLAAQAAQLDLVIFDDEAEAIVRLLMDRGLSYQATQQRWSHREGGPEWTAPGFVIGTPGMDAQIHVLPIRAERMPLFSHGHAVWLSKADPASALSTEGPNPSAAED